MKKQTFKGKLILKKNSISDLNSLHGGAVAYNGAAAHNAGADYQVGGIATLDILRCPVPQDPMATRHFSCAGNPIPSCRFTDCQ